MTTWLTGVVNPYALKEADHPQLGLLITPDTPQYEKFIPAFETWAADNACFSQAKQFDPERWKRWLDGGPRQNCLWATAPDVVGNHQATLKRSIKYLKLIRDMGFNAAFVAQNGAKPDTMPWDDFDALFIGGTPECIPCGWTKPADADREMKHCPFCGRKLTEWKLGQEVLVLVAEAKRRSKPVHVGRVNTGRRFRWCREVAESDTADGTMLCKKAPEVGIKEVLGWLNNRQLWLPTSPANQTNQTQSP